jgi:ATP-dependent 26S proteasome regulatory subunit
MSKSNWILLCVVNSLDDIKAVAKSHNVCQYRTNNLKDHKKYSFKCSQYRKYSSCNYELKAVVPDDDSNSITVMFKNTHNHSDHNQTSRLPSPLRQSVSKYVHAGLTEPQIRSLLSIDHPTVPVPSSKLK